MNQNKYPRKYLFGFSLWKSWFINLAPFFHEKLIFINPLLRKNHLKKALKKGLSPECTIYIWGKKSFQEVEHYAYTHRIPIFRVEDGFIRSVGLGSDLTQPYSLVVDSRGIYFDPTQPSDLEYLLENYIFNENELNRAKKIRKYLVDKKISKYNLYDNRLLQLPKGQMIVFVPGQVEDDASIRFGAEGMSNLELLQKVRANRPDAYIVFKPHPDVLVGNRVGHIEANEALKYCDRIVTEVGIDSILAHADEVHTMTSLVGFEALLRGVHVVTYGLPFYAGWGLSEDMRRCDRRSRKLSLDELVAGTYLLYPRYINPQTHEPSAIEVVLDYLDTNRGEYRQDRFLKIRNWLSRKAQALFRAIKN